MCSSLVRAQLDDVVRQEQPHVHISLRDVSRAAVPARLGAVPCLVSDAVAIVAGVVAVRPAIAAGVTSFLPTPAAGVASTDLALSPGLVLPSATRSATPLLAILGRAGIVPLLATGAPLLRVQQLALLLRHTVLVLHHLESPGDIIDTEILEVEEGLDREDQLLVPLRHAPEKLLHGASLVEIGVAIAHHLLH